MNAMGHDPHRDSGRPAVSRAAQRRAEARRARRPGGQAANTQSADASTPTRSLTAAAVERERAARRAGLLAPRAPRARVVGGAAGVVFGVIAVLSVLLYERPLLAGRAAGIVGAGAAAGAVGVWAARPAWAHVGRRIRRAGIGLVAGVFVFGAIGMATQDTIDGIPVFRGSATATAAGQVRTLIGDLEVLVRADELLLLPIDQIRVRSDELERTRVELLEIVDGRGDDINANATLTEAARAIVLASDAGAEALQAAVDVSREPNDRRSLEATQLRTTMVSEALRAGQLVRVGAEQAGVSEVVDAPVRE